MSIHHEITKKIRGLETKLIFFDKNFEKEFNPKYIKIVKNSRIIEKDNYTKQWFIKDTKGNDYKLRKLNLNIEGETAIIKEDRKMKIMTQNNFNLFIKNNNLSENLIIDDDFIDKYIIDLKIFSKTINTPITIWNQRNLLNETYSAILIVNNDIVGRVTCEVLEASEMKEFLFTQNIIYPNMNLYISNVDIRYDYQGKGLCKPLLSFMISQLKRLGFELLFIENASRTKGGIPACICYYKSGIDNNYKMRYKTRSKAIKKMKIDDCKKKPKPTSYYYISDKIGKRALNKIRTIIKTKNFKKYKKYKKTIKPKK